MRNGEKASQLIMCIGVSSGLGRLGSGLLADLPAVKRNGNRIVLQQVSLIVIYFLQMLKIYIAGLFRVYRRVHDAADPRPEVRGPRVRGHAHILLRAG